ncbi:hypothetical protein EYC98_14445 [Halieaceae bacterium IMCC14734]|uniref:Porin n=1 Tax=Candidatus Litorirhabdus singularis TaxID=2518993 RepID=A0ABT3TI99_9GAMM|nr:carbohydrate porin [Candidatus Litorirhabdus singularis]MCX2982058.1 hypothetical protein [Candidatus Litorirhabdus singularis]
MSVISKGLFVAATVLLTCGVPRTWAAQLDGALDALATGEHYLNVSLVPLYQYASRADTDTGNYTFDVIGKFTLLDAPARSAVGNTDLVFWVNSSDKFGGLDSTTELSHKAGLLWDTNDIAAESSSTTILVLGLEQWLFQDRVSMGMGKFFPGQVFLSSAYTADNSNGFTSKMISGNPVVSWWESIGIGANAAYWGKHWSIQAAFVDSKAEQDLDFSSFADGKYAYLLESTYSPPNDDGDTAIGAVIYYIDEREQRESESGVVAQFTHEWGDSAKYAVFGRYSFRDGGESQNLDDPSIEAALEQGGLLGVAWNRPFGRTDQQLAASLIYGKPADYRKQQGFDTQYGTEIFWKWQPRSWLTIIPNLQLTRNFEDNLETVVGLRIGVGIERNWAESSVFRSVQAEPPRAKGN